jgi:hypothetical protein
MKLRTQYISIPTSFFENTQLLPLHKWALIYIDALPQGDSGAIVKMATLAAHLGLSRKELNSLIKDLRNRKALIATKDEDGNTYYKAMLYNKDYSFAYEMGSFEEDANPSVTLNYDFIMNKWNEINPGLPQISRMTPQRKLKTRTCLQKNGIEVADLIKIFEIVSVTGFLQHGTDGTWCADYDWIVRDNKGQIAKILEGGYCKTYLERQAYDEIMDGVHKIKDSEFQ